MNAKELYGQGEELFSKRTSLMLFLQEVAEHFYPERADFTYQRSLGTDFAGNMMSSYPMMCRRDLGEQIGQMLRPSDKEYANIVPVDLRRQDNEAQRWLEWAAKTQRRAMYDRRAQFNDSQKMADNDYSAFGMCCTQVRMASTMDRLLYMDWHLRDVAWLHDVNREICGVWRRAKITARDLVATFKGKVHEDIRKCLEGSNPKPFEEFECYHIEVKADMYDMNAGHMEWWSIWYDCKHNLVLEEIAIPESTYVIGRWLKPGSSQYAFSPAVTVALPEGRLLQAITYTLVEAGEKIVNPPLIATSQAVRSDINVFAGGITWADRDYDEKTGEVLRPMNIDSKGMPLGMDMLRDSRMMINQAFYLNKLSLPQRGGAEMTAYEVGQRVQEYIRNALPLFEPMEDERNGQIFEKTFNLMRRHGAFGSDMDMPKSLQGAELQFIFESPLHDAIDAVKGHKFLEAQQYLAAAAQLDPTAGAMIDVKETLRDVLMGVKVPAKWVRSEVTVQQIEDQHAAAQQAQAQLAAMQQGSEVVGNLAAASKDNAAAAIPA
tara:strand:- start:21328 stop:22968 length:1641 start_codon:yes stop_codon:yes gene_type:complete